MKKQLVLQAILTVVMLVIWVLFYPKLPDTLPAHWDINGNIDRFAQKSLVMCMLIGLLLLSTMLYVIVPLIDPKRKSYIYSLKNYNRIQLITFIFFFILNLMILYTGFHQNISSPKMVYFFIGALFLFLGNYSASLKQNFFIGIRTPWTLSDENVWNKTNRKGAQLLVISGILICLGGFLPGKIPSVITAICIMIMIVFPFLYSYWLFRKRNE